MPYNTVVVAKPQTSTPNPLVRTVLEVPLIAGFNNDLLLFYSAKRII